MNAQRWIILLMIVSSLLVLTKGLWGRKRKSKKSCGGGSGCGCS